MSVELRKTYWQTTAESLFLADYEDTKKFYQRFTDPVALYQEVAQRIGAIAAIEPGETYATMYRAHMTDTVNNNHVELDALIEALQYLTTPEE